MLLCCGKRASRALPGPGGQAAGWANLPQRASCSESLSQGLPALGNTPEVLFACCLLLVLDAAQYEFSVVLLTCFPLSRHYMNCSSVTTTSRRRSRGIAAVERHLRVRALGPGDRTASGSALAQLLTAFAGLRSGQWFLPLPFVLRLNRDDRLVPVMTFTMLRFCFA